MMQRPAAALRVFGRPADDVHHRYMLGIAARDGVGRRKLADTECRYHSGHSAQSPVTVGGVAGVELVRVAHPPDVRVGDDVVEELQVVVAGNTEDFGDAEFGETVQQVVTDGVGSSHGIDGTPARKQHRSDAASLSCGPWPSRNPAK